MSSPLFDTLFRPTTPAPRASTDAATELPPASARPAAAIASAAPVRTTGTRTRAGNAMSRTRSALLSGAAQAVAASGTRIAMAQVATAAGVAKATLYNHFRTREAVLDALVTHEVTALIEAAAGKPIERALIDTAMAISRHPVRQGLAAVEPAALARLSAIDDDSEGWCLARAAVAEQLAQSGRGGADTVVRWLGSFLLSPASSSAIVADVVIVVAGLPVLPAADGSVARSA
ncbi:TetR/AcrR family transcriptional regulator [uncultured Jatrophihabitans sp.]|uniref:TetR/AcrR family transcriptional regulator n=1 Tax=uncultured Jatrophihabitans sp. TaxID=1610747 RepID=UPI0035CA7B3F